MMEKTLGTRVDHALEGAGHEEAVLESPPLTWSQARELAKSSSPIEPGEVEKLADDAEVQKALRNSVWFARTDKGSRTVAQLAAVVSTVMVGFVRVRIIISAPSSEPPSSRHSCRRCQRAYCDPTFLLISQPTHRSQSSCTAMRDYQSTPQRRSPSHGVRGG